MQNGIMSFSMANFVAIIGVGITVIGLLVKLVWQASGIASDVRRIGVTVDQHEVSKDDHEHRITRLESAPVVHSRR